MIILIMLILSAFSHQYLCKNSCKLSNLDQKMKDLTKMLGDAKAKWPENTEQKHLFCKQMYEASEHAKFFKKQCYRGISKSLMKFTIHALEYNNIKLSCKSTDEMNRFLKRGKCGNKGKVATAKCWTDWIGKITPIKNVTLTDKVPQFCCSISEWKKCSLDVYRSLGQKVCSKESIVGFDNYMQRSIIDPLNIIFHCVDHDNKSCAKLSKQTTRASKQRPRYKTPFPAILGISDSL